MVVIPVSQYRGATFVIIMNIMINLDTSTPEESFPEAPSLSVPDG